jgi:hypothetical protein
MTSILINSESIPETAPIALNFHLIATLNITAEIARRQVNHQVIPALGTGLIARQPELMIEEEQIIWRVPISMSLPELGDLGIVGHVAVDARTGELSISDDTQKRIIQHARRLYTGATLQTE